MKIIQFVLLIFFAQELIAECTYQTGSPTRINAVACRTSGTSYCQAVVNCGKSTEQVYCPTISTTMCPEQASECRNNGVFQSSVVLMGDALAFSKDKSDPRSKPSKINLVASSFNPIKPIKSLGNKLENTIEKGAEALGNATEVVTDAVHDGVKKVDDGVGDLGEAILDEGQSAAKKTQKELLRTAEHTIKIQENIVLASIHPITSNVKSLQVVDRLVQNFSNVQRSIATNSINNYFEPQNLAKIGAYRNYYNDVHKELEKSLKETVGFHNGFIEKFGDQVLEKIDPEMNRWVKTYIDACNTGVDVAKTVTSFDNAVRIAMVSAGSSFLPPLGSALANVMVDKLILKRPMTTKEMVQSFATGLAAGYAASVGIPDNPSFIQGLRSTLQRDLTKAIADKGFNGKDPDPKELLTSLMTAAVTINQDPDHALIKKDVNENLVWSPKFTGEIAAIGAVNGLSSNVISQAVNTKTLKGDEAFRAALTGAGSALVESVVAPIAKETVDVFVTNVTGFYAVATDFFNETREREIEHQQRAIASIDEKEQLTVLTDISKISKEARDQAASNIYRKKYSELTEAEKKAIQFQVALQKNYDSKINNRSNALENKIAKSLLSLDKALPKDAQQEEIEKIALKGFKSDDEEKAYVEKLKKINRDDQYQLAKKAKNDSKDFFKIVASYHEITPASDRMGEVADFKSVVELLAINKAFSLGTTLFETKAAAELLKTIGSKSPAVIKEYLLAGQGLVTESGAAAVSATKSVVSFAQKLKITSPEGVKAFAEAMKEFVGLGKGNIEKIGRIATSGSKAGKLTEDKVVKVLSDKVTNEEKNNIMSKLLSDAKRTSEKQFETKLEDGSKVIFRKESHPITSKYPNGEHVPHYNVEVHSPSPLNNSRWDKKLNLHLIIDENGNLINSFL